MYLKIICIINIYTNMNDIDNFKYYCEKCNYKCNIISRWDKHINTTLHNTGKKK